jgi:RNA polymerase sigma factor (sigma-70 family)
LRRGQIEDLKGCGNLLFVPGDSVPLSSGENSQGDVASLLAASREVIESLFAQSRGTEWGLDRSRFVIALQRSAQKRFGDGALTREALEGYLNTLYLEDLALSTACMDGSEAAWEYFVREYRGYLRAAAGAITKNSRAGSNPQELADSLFADLFGLADGKRGEHSLLRYFHGRSSLKTWLRAVLAQRHVDEIRVGRRWESLDGEEESNGVAEKKVTAPALDPHRERYLNCFVAALENCLAAMEGTDRRRLDLYYAQQMTLAEIGRKLGEHESSVSRNLERIRKELRTNVEKELRAAKLSEAEISLCLQYAAEEAPIDFRKIFPEKRAGGPSAGRETP